MSPVPQTLPRERILALLREQPARTAILCDIDGTLAPIVDATGGRGRSRATRAGAGGPRATGYALVACISGPRGPRRRGGWSASTRSPTSATTGSSASRPGADEPEVDPGARSRSPRACGRSPHAHFDDRAAGRRRAARGQGRDLGLPLARRAATRTRARAALEQVAAAAREAGSSRTGGAWCSRSGPPATVDKGTAVDRRPRRRAGRARALRRRRHDRSRRLPAAARAPGRGDAGARRSASGCVARGPAGDRRRGGPRRGRARRSSASCSPSWRPETRSACSTPTSSSRP